MTVYDAKRDIYVISSSSVIFAAIKYGNFSFTLQSVRNFKLIVQLRENNLKQSGIHMNNISDISLNIIFPKYVSVSHDLYKSLLVWLQVISYICITKRVELFLYHFAHRILELFTQMFFLFSARSSITMRNYPFRISLLLILEAFPTKLWFKGRIIIN